MLYIMAGNKLDMLGHEALAGPLLAAAKSGHVNRVIDAFAGTAAVSLWLASRDTLPAPSVLNELTPYRHLLLDQLFCQGNAQRVIDELNRYAACLEQVVYKTCHGLGLDADDIDEAALEDWAEKARFSTEDAKACGSAVKDFLLREAARHWPPGDATSPINSPTNAAIYLLLQRNMFKLGNPVDLRPVAENSPANADRDTGMMLQGFTFQMLGTPAALDKTEGTLKIRAFVSEMVHAIRAAAPLLAGKVEAKRTDGWTLSAKSSGGDLTIVDPPYLLKPGQGPKQAMSYFRGSLPEYRPGGAYQKVLALAAAWQRGARFVLTNRHDDEFMSMLGGMGWHLSAKIESGRMEEFVASNFDVGKGAAIRPLGLGMPDRGLPAPPGERESSDDPSTDPLYSHLYRKRIFGPQSPPPASPTQPDESFQDEFPGANGPLTVSARYLKALQDRSSPQSQSLKYLPGTAAGIALAINDSACEADAILEFTPLDPDRYIWRVEVPSRNLDLCIAFDPSLREIEDVRQYQTVRLQEMKLGADKRMQELAPSVPGTAVGVSDGYRRQMADTRTRGALRKSFGLQTGQEEAGLQQIVDCINAAIARGAGMTPRNEGWNIHSISIEQPNAWNRPFEILVAFTNDSSRQLDDVKAVWNRDAEEGILQSMENAARARNR